MPTGSSETESNVDPDIVQDQIVVRFREAIPSEAEDSFSVYGDIIQHVENLRFITLQVNPDDAMDTMKQIVNEHDGIEEIYQPRRVYALYTPNDPLLGNQWGVDPINVDDAWDTTLGDHSVKIAILDTGTMYNHEDLTPNTSQGNSACGPDYNVFTGGSNAADDHFHGTHVAGTASGVTDNGKGVAGMSQSCIQTVKVLNSWGSGTWEGVAEGIDFAAQNGAHIISMSLGGGGQPPQVLEDAVVAADTAGVFIIAAAGNSGCGSNTVLWPARYDQVMAVAALQSPGNTRAGFSSCGPDVEISAPGASIISARLGGGYFHLSGTSMATPHVSGVAGLMKAVNPTITNGQMRCILNDTATDLGPVGRDNMYGHGRMDAAAAVLRAETFLPIDPCFLLGELPELPIQLPL